MYSSSLSTWRRQRKAAELAALAPHKRGPKPDPPTATGAAYRPAQRATTSGCRSRLDKALFVIEVQKKLAALLGHPIDDNGEST